MDSSIVHWTIHKLHRTNTRDCLWRHSMLRSGPNLGLCHLGHHSSSRIQLGSWLLSWGSWPGMQPFDVTGNPWNLHRLCAPLPTSCACAEGCFNDKTRAGNQEALQRSCLHWGSLGVHSSIPSQPVHRLHQSWPESLNCSNCFHAHLSCPHCQNRHSRLHTGKTPKGSNIRQAGSPNAASVALVLIQHHLQARLNCYCCFAFEVLDVCLLPWDTSDCGVNLNMRQKTK